MFEAEREFIEAQIRGYCEKESIPLAELKWTPIPFSGEWGFSTSFFGTAASMARAGGQQPVPVLAQQLAERVKAALDPGTAVHRIDAVKGYLNLYFTASEYTRRVVDEVLQKQGELGRGYTKGERVMWRRASGTS